MICQAIFLFNDSIKISWNPTANLVRLGLVMLCPCTMHGGRAKGVGTRFFTARYSSPQKRIKRSTSDYVSLKIFPLILFQELFSLLSTIGACLKFKFLLKKTWTLTILLKILDFFPEQAIVCGTKSDTTVIGGLKNTKKD